MKFTNIINKITWRGVWNLVFLIIVASLAYTFYWLWKYKVAAFYTVTYWVFKVGVPAAILAFILWMIEKMYGLKDFLELLLEMWLDVLYWAAATTASIAEQLSEVSRASLRGRGLLLLAVWLFDSVCLISLLSGQMAGFYGLIVGIIAAIAILQIDRNIVDPNQKNTAIAVIVRIVMIFTVSCVVGEYITQNMYRKNIETQVYDQVKRRYEAIDVEYDEKIQGLTTLINQQQTRVDSAEAVLKEEMKSGYAERSVAKKEMLDNQRERLTEIKAQQAEEKKRLLAERESRKKEQKSNYSTDDLVKGAVALHNACNQSVWLAILVWATRIFLVCVSLTPVYMKYSPVEELVRYVKHATGKEFK